MKGPIEGHPTDGKGDDHVEKELHSPEDLPDGNRFE
jgi:hypothetical protein